MRWMLVLVTLVGGCSASHRPEDASIDAGDEVECWACIGASTHIEDGEPVVRVEDAGQ